jgi:hypothetical protein
MAVINAATMKCVFSVQTLKVSAQKIVSSYLEKTRALVSNLVATSGDEVEELKREVWSDLSAIYYKYESNAQKRALREILQDISNKIVDGQWDSVYSKLYKIECNYAS